MDSRTGHRLNTRHSHQTTAPRCAIHRGQFDEQAACDVRSRREGYSNAGPAQSLVPTYGWPVQLLWCSWKRVETGDEVDPRTAIVLNEPGAADMNSVASVLPFRPIGTGQLIIGSFWDGVVLSVRALWWVILRGWREQCGKNRVVSQQEAVT